MSSGEKAFKDGDDYRIQQTMEKKMQKNEAEVKTVSIQPKKKRNGISTRVDKKEKLSIEEIGRLLKPFNPRDSLKPDSLINVVSPRRAGKSTIIEYMIHEYMQKHTVDSVFLISKSGTGFKNIPSDYRFNDIAILDDIINMQLQVRKHNEKCDKKDRVHSRVIVIIDDFIDKLNNDVKRSNTITKFSTLGRHLAGKVDKKMGNGLMLILISQSFCAIPPTIRQNCDFTLCTSLANRIERKKIVDEYFTLYSSRFGLDEAYNVFDVATRSEEYLFCVINGTASNKFSYDDYIFTYKAPGDGIPFYRWSAKDDEDCWAHNEKEVLFW